jgi:hypothetical protein
MQRRSRRAIYCRLIGDNKKYRRERPKQLKDVFK